MVPVFFMLSVILRITENNAISVADYKHHIVFKCGYPAMVYQNDKWVADYTQDCIKEEMGIVSYCNRRFPTSNISSAAPAMEKIRFTKWCDFDNQNCVSNIEIRPFKCLESNVQSDALTVPKDCIFGHLGGKRQCKIYKEWADDARKQCAKYQDYEVRSFGMLFQCGKTSTSIEPMFFRGVEFVCCPNHVKTFISNHNVEQQKASEPIKVDEKLENDEEMTYNSVLKKLDVSENILKKDIIKQYKDGENHLKEMWKSNPVLSKKREDKLITQFKNEFNDTISQHKANKEKLLQFHNERLLRIFSPKYKTAMRKFEESIMKPVQNMVDIREAMKLVLHLLMVRKNEILQERFNDKMLGSNLIFSLNQELKDIANTIAILFQSLNKVPQFKISIKQHMLMYLRNTFPRISFDKSNQENKYSGQISEMNKIVSEYRYQPGAEDIQDNGDGDVHYDLGLHDTDQVDHGRRDYKSFITHHKSIQKRTREKNLLFVLIFSSITIGVIVVLIGFVLIVFRRRLTPHANGYSKAKFLYHYNSKPMLYNIAPGNGINNGVVTANEHYNHAYTLSHTDTIIDPDNNNNNNNNMAYFGGFVDKNMSLPLIKS